MLTKSSPSARKLDDFQTGLMCSASCIDRSEPCRPSVSGRGMRSISCQATSSALRFHSRNRSTVYLRSSSSINFAQSWQSHMPLSTDRLSSLDMRASYLGPPGEAAQIWAPTPILIALSGSSCGPVVNLRQPGLEHRDPTRLARSSRSRFRKSCVRLPAMTLSLALSSDEGRLPCAPIVPPTCWCWVQHRSNRSALLRAA